ncbi:MAG: peptide chain release factor N(5)-glutamine methyltransferase [Terricaulis sp.]
MTNLVTLWRETRDRLIAAGVDTPVLDARVLLEAGAGVSRTEIITEPRRVLTGEQVAKVEALVKRREAREPIGHIVGIKPFWTIELAVNRDVLTPRPETEFVVEVGIQALSFAEPSHVLDLGVGSGAILFSILGARPLATGVGVDKSEAALAVAHNNAHRLGLASRVALREGDWADGLDAASFDLVVSNPPYIRSYEIDRLEPEVAKYEPRLALDGGFDGLAAYRQVFPAIRRVLKPGGAFAVELGIGQAEAAWALADDAGLTPDEVNNDLSGVPRVIRGRLAQGRV